jgi:hypothetical protein
VLRCDEAKKTISVTPVKGAAETRWESFYIGKMHGHVLAKMREILCGEDDFAYLSPSCRAALAEARANARSLGIAEHDLVPLGSSSCAIFPWLGTPQLQALRLALKQCGIAVDICPGGFSPVYLQAEAGEPAVRRALNLIRLEGIRPATLPVSERLLPKGKFDAFMPRELLLKQARAYLE